MIQHEKVSLISNLFENREDIQIAVLIGSQANGTSTETSDWDLAILWSNTLDQWKQLSHTEQLRNSLSETLKTSVENIDIIDMCQAGLAMREVIANEGLLLKGDGKLVWHHFLLKTWRELEDAEWFNNHAA